MSDRALLDEQIAYYRARAPEYEEWFFREGRYDQGPERQSAWFAEVAAVEDALGRARPAGSVLELACGTGLWTRHLARAADRVLAVDAAPETIALNAARVASANVSYECADVFGWEPRERFDFVFFGFWLSHVPPERFDAFWASVRAMLAPGGRVFFVDNLRPSTLASASSGEERALNDGRRFRIVKVFYEPEPLAARLRRLGFAGTVASTGRYFLYGVYEAAA
jgi:2-polyprenyl-3-methyl-5-hydroxy-6-metoxy-1,4-benzoquinol methylase